MMKRCMIASIVLASAMVPMSAQITTEYKNDKRPFYGYFSDDAVWGNAYGFGMGRFNDPQSVECLLDFHDFMPSNRSWGLYAGAGVDGLIYAYEYNFVNSLEPPHPTNFVTYNIYTGRRTVLSPWHDEEDDVFSLFRPLDMTYDIKSGKMYLLGNIYGTKLYEVNMENGERTKICDLDGGVTLAANGMGELYTITQDGWLCRIMLPQGNLQKLAKVSEGTLGMAQSMTFDLTTGTLFWGSLTSEDSRQSYLTAIDMSDKDNIKAADLGTIGYGAMMKGLYIPYADNLGAPAAPSDIKTTPDASNPLQAKISWMNPTTTMTGEDMASLSGIVIKRNGEEIKYISGATPGERMEYTDRDVTETGSYRYDIIATNGKGDGVPGVVYPWLGTDLPGDVTDITLSSAEDMKTVTIEWKAPQTGYHDGYINPEDITYTVTRLPDNKKFDTPVKDTKFVDETINRVLNYSYEVTATNATGSTTTASTTSIIAGRPLETPAEWAMGSDQEVTNQWTLIDGNNDFYSWIFNSTMGGQVFGDYEPALEFILSPLMAGDNMQDDDEWLISPPLKFIPGKSYEITISIRSLLDEDFEVYLGDHNSQGAMTTRVSDLKVNGVFDNALGAKFDDYRAYFVPEKETGAVGFHLVTPLDETGAASFLQINNITIKEGVNSVEALEADAIRISFRDNVLTISGDYVNAEVYSAAGMHCGSYTGSAIDMSAMTPGVYVVNIHTADGVRTEKVMVK